MVKKVLTDQNKITKYFLNIIGGVYLRNTTVLVFNFFVTISIFIALQLNIVIRCIYYVIYRMFFQVYFIIQLKITCFLI